MYNDIKSLNQGIRWRSHQSLPVAINYIKLMREVDYTISTTFLCVFIEFIVLFMGKEVLSQRESVTNY